MLGRTSGVIDWAGEGVGWDSGVVGRAHEALTRASGVIGRAGGKIDGAQGRGSWAARGIGRACRPLQTARPRRGAGPEQAAQASGLAGLRGLRDRRVFIASLRVSRLVPLPKTLVSA